MLRHWLTRKEYLEEELDSINEKLIELVIKLASMLKSYGFECEINSKFQPKIEKIEWNNDKSFITVYGYTMHRDVDHFFEVYPLDLLENLTEETVKSFVANLTKEKIEREIRLEQLKKNEKYAQLERLKKELGIS